MGVNWGLIRIDATTNDDMDEHFDAEPDDPSEVDLVLIGKKSGPALRLFKSTLSRAPLSRPPGFCDIQVVDSQDMQTCAKSLRNIKKLPAVGADEYARDCHHSIHGGEEQAALNDST